MRPVELLRSVHALGALFSSRIYILGHNSGPARPGVGQQVGAAHVGALTDLGRHGMEIV